MRKLIFQVMVSKDGLFEVTGNDANRGNLNGDFNHYAISFLNNVDMLFFGRLTYEKMMAYWTTPMAAASNPVVTERMNNLPKIVFSKTLQGPSWNNTRVVNDSIVDEVRQLKQQPGKDIAMFGSSGLALTFIEHNLIDEFRIIVSPVAPGKGKRLFEGLDRHLDLQLVQTTPFHSGNIMFTYK